MGAKKFQKKDGRFPIFFFLGRPSSFFFLMGGFPLDAHRPPIFFFFLGRPSSSFFLMGVFLRFFFNPQKIKSQIWLLDTFLLLLKQIPFFWKFIRPSLAHLFFFLRRPSSSKKKDGRYFLAPIFRPSSFFFPPIFRLSLLLQLPEKSRFNLLKNFVNLPFGVYIGYVLA